MDIKLAELDTKNTASLKWEQVTHHGGTFHCEYWDCTNKISDGEDYYAEHFDDGNVSSYCVSCAAVFMAQKLSSIKILPASSEMKLIDNTEANGYGFPFRVFEAWKDGRNKQLADDQKAHASILAEKEATIAGLKGRIEGLEKSLASILAEKAREIKELVDALELAELWLKERLADDHVDLEKIRSVIAKYGG